MFRQLFKGIANVIKNAAKIIFGLPLGFAASFFFSCLYAVLEIANISLAHFQKRNGWTTKLEKNPTIESATNWCGSMVFKSLGFGLSGPIEAMKIADKFSDKLAEKWQVDPTPTAISGSKKVPELDGLLSKKQNKSFGKILGKASENDGSGKDHYPRRVAAGKPSSSIAPTASAKAAASAKSIVK